MTDLNKTFYIKTYGCQMNELDSEIIIGQLEKGGWTPSISEEDASLFIFNTCAVRDLAEQKVIGKVGELLKRKKNHQIIGIMGCMAATQKESLFRKFPHLDFVLGPNNLMDLLPALDNLFLQKKHLIKTDKNFFENIDYTQIKRKSPLNASVSIIRGCNKFCSYCVVPHTRGKEVSRPPQSIIDECKQLVDNGYKEILLLGQNVNSYGKDTPASHCYFPDLLAKLDAIPGLLRIRFMTSHPIDISLDLMHAIRDLPSVCEFVHFPIQSASNRILQKMHRMYSKELYMEKVSLLTSIVPNVQIGTDIIIGFPTETEEEFLETYSLFNTIRYSAAFIFAYSPRPNTFAYLKYPDDVPHEIKQQRLQSMLALHKKIHEEDSQKKVGKILEVLVEKTTDDGTLLKGRTRTWDKVLFPGSPSLIGTLQKITIENFAHQTLLGKNL
ncbi:MAG: tRNA (N6-isopentenyl adenosine(37)-C2)-methylthiotransferase MiaB [Chlamydiota bacterium]